MARQAFFVQFFDPRTGVLFGTIVQDEFCGVSFQKRIKKFLEDGYYAEGVALIREAPNVSLFERKFFEGYLGRDYVPSDVERKLREGLGALVEEGGMTEFLTSEEEDVKNLDIEEVKGAGEDGGVSPMGAQVRVRGAVSGTFWGALFAGQEVVPSALWELYQEAVGLHKRQAHLHPLMCDAAVRGEKKKAREMAGQIMEEIVPRLDEIYDVAREWGASGKLPSMSQQSDIVKETVEKMRRMEYCKQRVSRIKKWLADGERTMTVEGKKQVVRLTEVELQGLRNEMLERQLEEKEIREVLGIDD